MGPDPILGELLKLQGRNRLNEPIDPRATAVERYMQEQGNDSRMPAYHPMDLYPRGGMSDSPPAADVGMSPNEEDYQAEQDAEGALRSDPRKDLATALDNFINEQMSPYYGGENTRRRFWPMR